MRRISNEYVEHVLHRIIIYNCDLFIYMKYARLSKSLLCDLLSLSLPERVHFWFKVHLLYFFLQLPKYKLADMTWFRRLPTLNNCAGLFSMWTDHMLFEANLYYWSLVYHFTSNFSVVSSILSSCWYAIPCYVALHLYHEGFLFGYQFWYWPFYYVVPI